MGSEVQKHTCNYRFSPLVPPKRAKLKSSRL
uniref:Uncharacterized protein n=1 Tax=Anguilla anguilla TaxID=7936 RepID=A0A0E9USJ1_ANGAN